MGAVSRTMVLALAFVVCSSPVFADTYAIGHSIPPYATLLSSDFVVRAIVRDARREVVPAGKYDLTLPPRMQLEGQFVKIQRATLEIKGVLKGVCNGPRIDVIARESAFLIGLEGREVILGTTFDENLMGGSYHFQPGAVFVRTEDGWSNRSGTHNESDVLRAIDAVSIENLAKGADIVASAVVASIREYPPSIISPKEVAIVHEWTLRFIRVRKCVNVPEAVPVHVIPKGSYWPAWRDPLPRRIQPGDSLYVFLKRDGEVYHVLGGVNGCFHMPSRGLIYNDHVLFHYSVEEVDRRVGLSLRKSGE